MGFHIVPEPADGSETPVVVVAEGTIDLDAAARLDETLRAAADVSDQVIVDFSAVDYLDTAGVRVLFQHARTTRLVLRFVRDGIIAPVIAASGLSRVVTLRAVDR